MIQLFILVLIVAIVFHECGHALMFYAYKRYFPKLHIEGFGFALGTDNDYKDLTRAQMIKVLLFGLLTGLIPIIAIIKQWIYVPLVILYIMGSMSDIKNIWRLIEWRHIESV